MEIDGDITVWVSNGYAFARFEGETKAGPVMVQASAPLAMVRQRLIDERGNFVEGEGTHVVGEGEVQRVAKEAAVGNLRRLAPYALIPPGALATYYGMRALKRRRNRPGAPPPPAEGMEADEAVEGIDVGAEASKQAASLALSVAQQDPKVRAGMFLLRRARRAPRARRKIRNIKAHAAAGNPQARRDHAALVKAQKVRRAVALQQRAGGGDSAAARRLAAMRVPRPPLLLAESADGRRYHGFFAAWNRGAE